MITLTEHFVRWTERDTLHARAYRAETGHWYDERGREWAAPYAICTDHTPRPLSEAETARWWQERLDEGCAVSMRTI